MKTSTKLKILGCCMVAIGATLIVLSCTVLAYYPFGDPFFGKTPQFGALVPGVFLCFFSIPIFITGFRPALMKMGAKLHSETMDHAGNEISKAGVKTVEVAAPVIDKMADAASPSITKLVGAVKKGIENPQKYCKHCGDSIDADSKFCKHCSKQQ